MNKSNSTLIKGLSLLETLAESERPLGVTTLAARVGMGKSNAHSLLQTLVQRGYVKQNEHAEYIVAVRLWQLARHVMSQFDLPHSAESFMQLLLGQTRETIHLSVLDHHEVVYLHKLDSPEPVRAYTQIGGRAPAHCVATGKALLAHQPIDWLNDYAQHLQAYTPTTIVDPELFLSVMTQVRLEGYAMNLGEWRESVHGLAVPVLSADGRAVAAIGVSGPAERLPVDRLQVLASSVVEVVTRFSKKIIAEAEGS